MKKKFLIIFMILIGTVFGYILGQYKSKEKELKNSYFYWDEFIKKHIQENNKIEKEIFDSIFNDKFFSKDYNPFEEIENFRKRMLKTFSDNNHLDIFNDSFSKWFEERILKENTISNEIEIKNKESENEYIIEIQNNIDKNSSVSVDVKQDYIKISYEKKNIDEKNEANVKSSFSSHIKSVKYFSLPPQIRGKDYNIETKDNKVIIKFKKN
ncbi:MAG: hypothetical protein N2Z20_03170 [Elusimicrobiales bacterium]|nr:hypothetical protein [Elusimicrobiales bacterium]